MYPCEPSILKRFYIISECPTSFIRTNDKKIILGNLDKANMSQEDFQFSPQYNFVRSRQLEGTFSQGREVGVWVVTGMRVAKGWGDPQESGWPYSTKYWPPQEPPDIDELAKKRRFHSYQRVRDANECREAIAGGTTFVAAFGITNQWFLAEGGIIEEPSGKNPIIGKSHAVCVLGFDDNKRLFTFVNSWGKHWGNHGYGYLSYEYFDKYILESWTIKFMHQTRPISSSEQKPGRWLLKWGISDTLGGVLHGIELYQENGDEFIGWAFAVRRWGGSFLDVEELFVRPNFRGSTQGRILAEELNGLAEREGLPLRLWIPHVDANQTNLPRVEKIAKRLGLKLLPSGVRWASLKAAP